MSYPVLVPRPAIDRPNGWLRRLKQSIARPKAAQGGIDIRGERDIEWSFLSQAMPNGPGKALDFGCEHGYMSLMAAQKVSMS